MVDAVNKSTTGLEAHQILIIASMDIMLNMKHTAVTFAKSHHNIGETNFRVKITLDCP